ncbi:hypothetical protein [Oceaniglobus trochenteri]|uniref:hypothetical protein n=1 Tax=Oceaniglobus trochenteri TaxID=2763260 RepID=UPI001CFF8505|nr:hypothetical protein [Oceaniglobus trochenteri]
MAIEFFTRLTNADSAPMRQVGSRFDLDGATDVTLGMGAPGIVEYAKIGPDLEIRFRDGQQLSLQDFFVIDAQGDFSRLNTVDGNEVITGLVAPEPNPEDIEVSDAGTGESIVTPQSLPSGVGGPQAPDGMVQPQADNEGVVDGDDGSGWSNPLLLGGLGLATGFGGTNLMVGEDLEGDSPNEPSVQDAGAAQAELAREIEGLVGADAEGTTLASEIETLFGNGADATAPAEMAPESDADAVSAAPEEDDPLGGLMGGWQDSGHADFAPVGQLMTEFMTEAEV